MRLIAGWHTAWRTEPGKTMGLCPKPRQRDDPFEIPNAGTRYVRRWLEWRSQGQVASPSQSAAGRAGPHPHVRRQPPVIGGKKAISEASRIALSGRAWTRSIAARTTPSFSKA